jgi:hypothetical protein
MVDLVITPTPTTTASGSESVVITAVVKDADWVGLYDRLQLFRSFLGPEGPFSEITGADWLPPRLPIDGGDPPTPSVAGRLVNVVGLTLRVIVQTTYVDITFAGSNPLTLAQCATQITGGAITSWVDSTGQLVIESNIPGSGSILAIIESDASKILELPDDDERDEDIAQGKDPRPLLVPGVKNYVMQDPFGDRSYHYRLQFLNRATEAVSEPSLAFSAGDDTAAVGADHVTIGYLTAATLEGRPLANAEVTIFSEFDGTVVGGRVLGNDKLVKLTDATGYVEFQLVRGKRITVSIQGTSLMRRLTTPTDVTSFDLLNPSIGEPDVFKAGVPDIVIAERRSL